MTSLLSLIKEMQLEARKAKRQVAVALLTTLIGEASMAGKNDGDRESTDAEVIATIKKFIKNAEETLRALMQQQAEESNEKQGAVMVELSILKALLPKQMNEQELRELINVLRTTRSGPPPTMGEIMKMLKQTYDGQYDGAMASRIAKEF